MQQKVAVIVPFKASVRAKSRIDLLPPDRSELAISMMRDSVAALLAAASVRSVLVVVEDQQDAVELLRDHRDVHHSASLDVMVTTAVGLNPAISAGLDHLRGTGWSGRTGALLADLPGLRPAEFDAAAAQALGTELAVVPDRQGSGSTLLVASHIDALAPCFGVDSLRRHQRAGAVVLDLPATSGLRHDVDELADLLPTAARPEWGVHTRMLVVGLADAKSVVGPA